MTRVQGTLTIECESTILDKNMFGHAMEDLIRKHLQRLVGGIVIVQLEIAHAIKES